jgi:hypothetical protein
MTRYKHRKPLRSEFRLRDIDRWRLELIALKGNMSLAAALRAALEYTCVELKYEDRSPPAPGDAKDYTDRRVPPRGSGE